MSSTDKPLIAVVGATGAQGGSVVQYLLNDPDHTFRVRALTRNVDSPKAKALAESAVEVVKADLNDVNSLKKAFEGVYGVFGVTNFWEVFSGEKETQHGKALVDAAVAAGVKHFVWSTLDHTSDPSVPHWDSKAAVDDYLKQTNLPRTSLYTAFYYENLLTFPNLNIEKDDAGKLVADWPVFWTDGPIGGYSAAETGAYVLEALKKPKEWIGKDLRVVSDVFTPRQFITAVSEVTGQEIAIREYDREKFNESRAYSEELWANMEYFYKHNGNPNRDADLTLRINPSRKDHRAFVQANKEAFIASFNL
ncbi:NmrA-domain-containing protein [Fomitiporia mediterranea MF3/22]|uniref:NmrA-domain-containing protein n=1 Tax=Fomitiporia mediterranea (strain MF3/22) TaxID=694068 RepID=UPI0004407A25|nr:NmrA-domain-containing protein [Fomitiporia mediterranea MF3/22]EJD00672.1 NmrA-domain-containing protein [Fomitiporia mediterranea MF3/22]